MPTRETVIEATTNLCEGISVEIEDALTPVPLPDCPAVVGTALAHHLATSMVHMAETYGADHARAWLNATLMAVTIHPDLIPLFSVKLTTEVHDR
jgi:hypothetical protein